VRWTRLYALGIADLLFVGSLLLLRDQPRPIHPAFGADPSATSVAAKWFQQMKPYCNTLEVTQHMAETPPPEGAEGAGYGAACYALAGRIGAAREMINSHAPKGYQGQAAAIVFNVGHPVADAGDDVAAGPIMDLVLEFWPENYQAEYHSGMSSYALGRSRAAEIHLERFLSIYHAHDVFTRNAARALDRIGKGLPPEKFLRGAHE
jgi:hypothetical protein